MLKGFVSLEFPEYKRFFFKAGLNLLELKLSLSVLYASLEPLMNDRKGSTILATTFFKGGRLQPFIIRELQLANIGFQLGKPLCDWTGRIPEPPAY